MVTESRLSGYRILIAAVVFSLAVHLFWLSAVKIVVSPGLTAHAKFSRVTFLGPILTKVNTEVRAERARRSYLEERYAKRLAKPAPAFGQEAGPRDARHDGRTDGNSAAETRYVNFVGAAVEKAKVEPEYGAE